MLPEPLQQIMGSCYSRFFIVFPSDGCGPFSCDVGNLFLQFPDILWDQPCHTAQALPRAFFGGREEGAKSILGASRAGVAKSGTGEGINPEPKDQIPKEQEPQGGQGQEGYLPWDHPLPQT